MTLFRLIALTLFALLPPPPPRPPPKPCDELKAEIAAKLEAKGVKGYTLDAVEADKVPADATVVGSCEAAARSWSTSAADEPWSPEP